MTTSLAQTHEQAPANRIETLFGQINAMEEVVARDDDSKTASAARRRRHALLGELIAKLEQAIAAREAPHRVPRPGLPGVILGAISAGLRERYRQPRKWSGTAVNGCYEAKCAVRPAAWVSHCGIVLGSKQRLDR
jgi:hypothetical protein